MIKLNIEKPKFNPKSEMVEFMGKKYKVFSFESKDDLDFFISWNKDYECLCEDLNYAVHKKEEGIEINKEPYTFKKYEEFELKRENEKNFNQVDKSKFRR